MNLILLLCAVFIAHAQDIDPSVEKNAESIFGTPDKPLVTGPSATTQNAIVQENIKNIFGPLTTGSPTPTTASATPKPTPAPVAPKVNLKPSPDADNAECMTKENKTGVCVTYYLCDPETKRLITDGETLIDVRVRECPHYLDVCCLAEDVNTTARVPPTGAPPTAAPTAPTAPTAAHGCGYSNFGDEESYRIVNDGTKAEFLEYPWMVALLRKTDAGVAWSQKDYLGGGSLIHPNVVLTAAHKIEGLSAGEIKCRAGEWDTQTTSEIYPYQEQTVKKIIRHEHFYRPSVLNSIALLVLSAPYTPSPNIGIACIGRAPPPPNTRCHGMGWGKDDFNSDGKYANILKKVEVPLLSRSDCQNALRRTRLGSFFVLHPSLTCAGGEDGKDTCGGDGGSPLVCSIGPEQDTRYAIYGMVAYGIGCGDVGIPGVYVNTPAFYSWIADQMKAEGFSTDSYTFNEK